MSKSMNAESFFKCVGKNESMTQGRGGVMLLNYYIDVQFWLDRSILPSDTPNYLLCIEVSKEQYNEITVGSYFAFDFSEILK